MTSHLRSVDLRVSVARQGKNLCMGASLEWAVPASYGVNNEQQKE